MAHWTAHCKRDPYDVLIDRSTMWGNPFELGRDGDRATVKAAHRRWLGGRGPDVIRGFSRSAVLANISKLRRKRLGCWCAPKDCHGDTLAELANMSETWLVIDSNNLCHRAYHTMGSLMHGDIMTGVVFGFLKEVADLQDLFSTQRVVFCFDHPHGHREALRPKYKESRRIAYAKAKPEEREGIDKFREQVRELRRTYLNEVGYNNVLCQKGFEADDFIASVCRALPPEDDAIIVATDKDLYQCLTPQVRIYNPHSKRIITYAMFRNEWGIAPDQWPDVKALAGCETDDVDGLPGVGEKTAARYLRDQLPKHYKTYQTIESREGQRVWRNNLPLVTLPFAGTPTPELVPDEVTREKWVALCDRLGLRSLRGHAPIAARAARIRSNGKGGEGFGL